MGNTVRQMLRGDNGDKRPQEIGAQNMEEASDRNVVMEIWEIVLPKRSIWLVRQGGRAKKKRRTIWVLYSKMERAHIGWLKYIERLS